MSTSKVKQYSDTPAGGVGGGGNGKTQKRTALSGQVHYDGGSGGQEGDTSASQA